MSNAKHAQCGPDVVACTNGKPPVTETCELEVAFLVPQPRALDPRLGKPTVVAPLPRGCPITLQPRGHDRRFLICPFADPHPRAVRAWVNGIVTLGMLYKSLRPPLHCESLALPLNSQPRCFLFLKCPRAKKCRVTSRSNATKVHPLY